MAKQIDTSWVTSHESFVSNTISSHLTEISDRTLADNSLSTVLSTEISNRISGDTSLANYVSNVVVGLAPDTLNTLAELASALNNDASYVFNLSNALSNETSNRISGDNSLSLGLSSEVIQQLL